MHLVTQKVVAEAAGVSCATVSRFMKKGAELWPARVKDKIDIEHAAALKFIEDRLLKHVDPSHKADRNRNKPEIPKEELTFNYNMDKLPKDIRDLSHLSLTELVKIYGDDIRFSEWLKAMREIEALEEKRAKNDTLRGKLVSREVVEVGIIQPVDQLYRQILQDGCKNMAVKAAAMAKAGKDTNEITEYLRSVMTTYFKSTQRNMLNAIDELEKKIDDSTNS